MNEYNSNSLKGCVLEVYLSYPTELCELHNDWSLAPDKIKIKEKSLSKYQIMISDFYSISIGIVKNCCLTFLIKEKYDLHYENLQLYLRLGLWLKRYILY